MRQRKEKTEGEGNVRKRKQTEGERKKLKKQQEKKAERGEHRRADGKRKKKRERERERERRVNRKKTTEEHISKPKQRRQIAEEVSTTIIFISPTPGMFTSLLSPCNKKRHSNSAPAFLAICKKEDEQCDGNLITFTLFMHA